MLFWILTAVLTFVVAAMLLMPLWRGAGAAAVDTAGEAAVYRDQLVELDRDRMLGLISAEDAGYARAEIGRRLIALSDETARTSPSGGGRHRVAQAFVLLCLPAVALGLYLQTGAPGLDSQPLAARLENPGSNIALLVAKVERHLAQSPDDGAGWDVLAPIYFRAGRLGDSEMAYRNAMRLMGVTAERLSGLGEVLIAGNDGVVTADARSAFEAALRQNPDNPKAEFYLALALEQAGQRDEARAAFEKIIATSPADAPWVPIVREHIAANGGEVPTGNDAAPGGPSAEDMAAAQAMSAEDRQAMIEGMVENLDARLKEDPDNFEGWMRLVRSYAMLNRGDKALEALTSALRTFPADGEQGRELVALAKDLGLPLEDALK